MFKSRLPNFSLRETQFSNTHKLKSDDHSVSVPPLPIPNRTVKRNRADDSVVRPCESRSSSDYPLKTPVSSQRWAFYFVALQDYPPIFPTQHPSAPADLGRQALIPSWLVRPQEHAEGAIRCAHWLITKKREDRLVAWVRQPLACLNVLLRSVAPL